MKNAISPRKRWGALIENEAFGIVPKSTYEQSTLGVLMENQYRFNKGALVESNSMTSDVAPFQKYAMQVARRMLPEQIASHICGVQPMKGPVELCFARRWAYDDGTAGLDSQGRFVGDEVGYNKIRADYTGTAGAAGSFGFDTATGELLSHYIEGALDDKNGIGAGSITGTVTNDQMNAGTAYARTPANIARLKLVVQKKAIEAEERKVRSQYTLEFAQDLMAQHDEDADAIISEGLRYELQAEIDRQLIQICRRNAKNATIGGSAPFMLDVSGGATAQAGYVLAGGKNPQERFADVANAIIGAANVLRITTRLGAGNVCVASPDVVTALQSLNSGIFTATQVSVDGTNMNSKVGTIHGTNIDVYVDTFATDSYALVGYRDATNAQNNGIVYMPYIPLQVVKSVMPYDGSPNIMMLSRYGVYANQLGSGCFYREIQFYGLANYFGSMLGYNVGNINDYSTSRSI